MTKPDAVDYTDNHHLEVLKDLAEALNEATDVTAAMAAILPRLGSVLGLSTAWAFRFDPKRRTFVEVGASGLPPALACNNAGPLKTGWCECQDQFVEGKLSTAVNIVRCSRLRDAQGDTHGLTFHASIPLRSKGKPLGILNVAAAGHSVFTKQALKLLTTIGYHVAVAVDRAGILADERQRASQLKAMSEMAAELVSAVRPSEILQFAVERFVQALGYEACGITMAGIEPSGEAGVRLVAAAHRREARDEAEYSYSSNEDSPCLPAEDRLLLNDARSCMVHRIPHSEYEIRLESRVAGAFGDVDADILSAFAWHVTAALENARLYGASLANAQWAERRKLAADLHDAVSQRLFSALLLTKTARLLAADSAATSQVQGTLDRIQTLISESQQEMRDLIQALRPTDDRGFVARLRERIAPLQLQSTTRIQLTADGSGELPVSFEQREGLLRVIDEALHNALKYAHAKHVYVNLHQDAEQLLVTVKDDGLGFDEATVAHGLGTSTMYERMHALGGTLRIQSTLGQGTTVLCELPLTVCNNCPNDGDEEETVVDD